MILDVGQTSRPALKPPFKSLAINGQVVEFTTTGTAVRGVVVSGEASVSTEAPQETAETDAGIQRIFDVLGDTAGEDCGSLLRIERSVRKLKRERDEARKAIEEARKALGGAR